VLFLFEKNTKIRDFDQISKFGSSLPIRVEFGVLELIHGILSLPR